MSPMRNLQRFAGRTVAPNQWQADVAAIVGAQGLRKNSGSHIDASHSRQPLVKGERLVRYEVNAVMHGRRWRAKHELKSFSMSVFMEPLREE